MRATRRRRPLTRVLTSSPGTRAGRRELAAKVSYVGSPEHKDTPSFAGPQPKPRPDASICDRDLAERQEQLTEWLRAAIEQGAFGELMEGEFPRYVWCKDGDTVYEARLVNSGQGTYKGYPLLQDEWPAGLTEKK
ncbi:hypothetical protein [Desulfonatronospira sp.]|uniref:hypothetical protein n=1 Tax=Desulfonatronospira sp. TaxID=1962951 RepID=UPI0025BA9401|nr:hypothetical protein [Desulfonatronospira sp.]